MVLGLVQDGGERTQGLVDRVVPERPERLPRARVEQRLSRFGRRADRRVLLMDPPTVGLDRLHGDLRREQFAEEGEEVARERPQVVLGRRRADLRVPAAILKPVRRKLSERGLLGRVVERTIGLVRPQPELELGLELAPRALGADLVPARAAVAERHTGVVAAGADAQRERHASINASIPNDLGSRRPWHISSSVQSRE
jgi:hypothetical protein